MFGATGKLSSIDIRNTTQTAGEAKNIAIFTVSPVSDSSWQSVSSFDNTPINNNLIKGRNSDYNLVGYSNTMSSASFTLNGTIGTGGGHSGSIGSSFDSRVTSITISGSSTTAASAGDHAHTTISTVTFNNASFLPTHIKTGLYQRNINSASRIFPLPIGTIVFAENILNNSGVVANSSYDNKYLCITNTDASMGTIGGSNTLLISTDSTSGSHLHGTSGGYGTRSINPNSSNYSFYGPYSYSMSGSHFHYVNIPTNHYKKYVKLKTYIVQNNKTYISSGMIFGFTSNIVSPNWYCCNGQTVNGYTTPNLVDRYIMCGNSDISSHNVKPITSDDINQVVYNKNTAFVSSADWYHSHGPDTFKNNQLQQVGDTLSPLYHSGVTVTHTHSITSTTSFTSNFEPNHFNLIYYIYLP